MTQTGKTQTRVRTARTGIGVGSVTILVVFTILSVTTLALISLSTAVSNRRINQRSLQSTENMARAEGQAAAKLADIDTALWQLQQQAPPQDAADESAYMRRAATAVEALGCQVDAGTQTASFSLPIDERNDMVCTLQLLPPGQPRRYVLLGMQAVMVGEWDPGEGGALWQGNN